MATSLRMLFAIHLLSLTYSATPARSQAHIRFEAGTKPGRQSKTAIASRLKAPSATDPSELPPGVAYPPPTLASGGDVVEDPLLLVSNCSANIRSHDAVFGDKFAQPIWRHAEFLAANIGLHTFMDLRSDPVRRTRVALIVSHSNLQPSFKATVSDHRRVLAAARFYLPFRTQKLKKGRSRGQSSRNMEQPYQCRNEEFFTLLVTFLSSF